MKTNNCNVNACIEKNEKKSEYKRKLIVKKRNGGKTEVLGGNYQYWNHKKMQNGMKKSEQMEKKYSLSLGSICQDIRF